MSDLKTRIVQAAAVCAVITTAAFSPMNDSREKTEYSLRFLTKAAPPEAMALMMAEDGAPRIKRGVLFSYAARGAKKALIAGDFNDWTPAPMTKGKNGIWYFFVAENPKETFRYKFLVDGIWISDPVNLDKTDDGSGSFVSVARGYRSGESRHVSFRILPDSTIEFRRWDDRAKYVSIVGDFNNWNPENDILSRDALNIWRLKKKLPKGTYRYKYIVDGQWTPDVYNTRSASDAIGGICSVLTIQ